MNSRGASAFSLAMAVVLIGSTTWSAADDAICSVAQKPQEFDHKNVTLKGNPVNVKETTSRRGNDYTTFKLQGPTGCAVSVFTWGHPTLSTCDQVGVEGVYETEHHQGRYTFYNEIEATKVSCLPR
jgi:hypothetical protein